MTPKEKLEQYILSKCPEDTEIGDGDYEDVKSEVREGDFKTNIPSPYSRNYESESVALKTLDGTFVGWTYYFGGGKHSQPECIDWMSEAYDLKLVKQEKVITVINTWEKV